MEGRTALPAFRLPAEAQALAIDAFDRRTGRVVRAGPAARENDSFRLADAQGIRAFQPSFPSHARSFRAPEGRRLFRGGVSRVKERKMEPRLEDLKIMQLRPQNHQLAEELEELQMLAGGRKHPHMNFDALLQIVDPELGEPGYVIVTMDKSIKK